MPISKPRRLLSLGAPGVNVLETTDYPRVSPLTLNLRLTAGFSGKIAPVDNSDAVEQTCAPFVVDLLELNGIPKIIGSKVPQQFATDFAEMMSLLKFTDQHHAALSVRYAPSKRCLLPHISQRASSAPLMQTVVGLVYGDAEATLVGTTAPAKKVRYSQYAPLLLTTISILSLFQLIDTTRTVPQFPEPRIVADLVSSEVSEAVFLMTPTFYKDALLDFYFKSYMAKFSGLGNTFVPESPDSFDFTPFKFWQVLMDLGYLLPAAEFRRTRTIFGIGQVEESPLFVTKQLFVDLHDTNFLKQSAYLGAIASIYAEVAYYVLCKASYFLSKFGPSDRSLNLAYEMLTSVAGDPEFADLSSKINEIIGAVSKPNIFHQLADEMHLMSKPTKEFASRFTLSNDETYVMPGQEKEPARAMQVCVIEDVTYAVMPISLFSKAAEAPEFLKYKGCFLPEQTNRQLMKALDSCIKVWLFLSPDNSLRATHKGLTQDPAEVFNGNVTPRKYQADFLRKVMLFRKKPFLTWEFGQHPDLRHLMRASSETSRDVELVMPCGHGKTLTAVALNNFLLEEAKKTYSTRRGRVTLVIAPTDFLKEQWFTAIELLGSCPEGNYPMIIDYSGKHSDEHYLEIIDEQCQAPRFGSNVYVLMTVAMLNTRILKDPRHLAHTKEFALKQEWFNGNPITERDLELDSFLTLVGQLIIDEAHYASTAHTKLLALLPRYCTVTLLTATPDRKDGQYALLSCMVGERFVLEPQFPKAEIKSLVYPDPDDGEFSLLKIPKKTGKKDIAFLDSLADTAPCFRVSTRDKDVLYMAHKDVLELTPDNSRAKWDHLFQKGQYSRLDPVYKATFRGSHPPRVIQVSTEVHRLWSKEGRKVLVLANRLSTVDLIYSDLVSSFGLPPTKIVKVVSDGFDENFPSVHALNNAEVIVAIKQLANFGLDVPSFDTLLLFDAQGDIRQASGRVERVYEGKKSPLVILPLDGTDNTRNKTLAAVLSVT